MSSTLGIVDTASLRQFPAPVIDSLANRRMGNASVVEWIVRRVSDAQQLDQVVLLCDASRQQDYAALVPPDIPVFGSDLPDPLSRFAACVDHYGASQVVRACVGNCFIDPELIDRLITSAQSSAACDYVSFCSADGRPAVHASIGVFAEWLTAQAVQFAHQTAKAAIDRADSTRFVYAHPELFRLRFINVPPPFDRDDIRLAVQFEEDWDHVQTILDALGPDDVDWQRIAGLLTRQPALRKRMALLNQASRAD